MRSYKKWLWISLQLAMSLMTGCSDTGVTTNETGRLFADGLTVEHMDSPLGIDASVPRLSWIAKADYNGAGQTDYEIRVSSDSSNQGEIWSSGKIHSSQSYNVEYAGGPLASNTRYYWSVRIWDGETVSDWSSPGWFETAFLDIAEFDAGWIGRLSERPESETPEVLLRKEFALADKPIDNARLYVSGLGYYKAYINGQRVGDHELDPAFTPFDERVLYVTYDVTDLLAGGGNVLGVSLGRGFYADYDNIDTSVAPWLSEPKLKLQLQVTYADGDSEVVNSDTSWLASTGPTLINKVKNGEVYDARLEQTGWNDRGFDDGKWAHAVAVAAPTGKLEAQDIEPVRVVMQMPEPVRSQVNETTTRFDFQTTRAGWATVGLKGPAGSEVTIRYGEKLKQGGTINSGNDGPFGGDPVQSYTYILGGNPEGESYTPSYSYNGYRFVQVEAPQDVSVTSIKGLVLSNDVAVTGSFSSSDALLNRYHDAMVRSLQSNMHHIPTDTPMYEKRGWAADALLMADSALMNLASENFWEKWMLDHRYNQAADGGIAVIVPNQDPGEPQADPFTGSTGDPIWSSSYVLVNHALYQQRNNIRTLEENYEGMTRWMNKWINTLEETDYLFTGTTWGDHEPAYGGGNNNYLVGTAYIYRSASALAEIAGALGQTGDQQRFNGFAEKVANAINAAYYDPDEKHYDFPYKARSFGGMPAGADFGGPPQGSMPEGAPDGGMPGGTGGAPGGAPPQGGMPAGAGGAPGGEDSAGPPAGFQAGGPRNAGSAEEINAKQFQTDNVLPLALGIVPEADRAALCGQLIEDVSETHDTHITTGATVLKDVMPVLTECGAAELAYRAAVNPTFPGWGYWFVGLNGTQGTGGETIIVDTFWEAWGEGARSHNHAFRGTIDDWLYQYLAGIQATSPGYATARIQPYPVGDISHAEASISTPLGELSSAWKRSENGFELAVQVPVGTTAEVYVPAGSGGEVSQEGGAEPIAAKDGYVGFKVGSGRYRFVRGM